MCPESTHPIYYARAMQRQSRRIELTLGDGYVTGVELFEQPPGQAARGAVVYLHGIQSHPGWYGSSCEMLAGLGLRVYSVMRRGSGDNALARGHAEHAGQLLDDVEHACRLATSDSGCDAVQLLGVSWGGKLALAYAAHRARGVKLSGLTLVAPGIEAKVGPSLATKAGIALALLVSPQRRFDIPLSQPELFTDNPPMLEYLRNDPARLHRATAKFLYASRTLDRQLRRLQAGAVTVPTTLVLASRDRIVDNDRTERTLRRLTAQGMLTVERLAGCHTLEFEQDIGPLLTVLARAAGSRDA